MLCVVFVYAVVGSFVFNYVNSKIEKLLCKINSHVANELYLVLYPYYIVVGVQLLFSWSCIINVWYMHVYIMKIVYWFTISTVVCYSVIHEQDTSG